MLVDEVRITIAAGHGGKGAVAFNKNLMSLGPAGGSGGRGGNVYAEGVSDLSALNHFRHRKEFAAENGGDGRSQFRDGSDGADLVLKLPVGTVMHGLTSTDENGTVTERRVEITRIGERVLLAGGGRGGKGNFHFRSSTNTSPTQFQEGTPGERFLVSLELKLIADVGLLGLPNAGKSSLLNTLTNAKSKVANYAFTTLEPHLGTYYELIIADIPGLIEGSSAGKGLGIKFLRHIERTATLFHLVSAESPTPADDYAKIRAELGAYNRELLAKPEYVFLSKSDAVTPEEVTKKLAVLEAAGVPAVPISIIDDASMHEVQRILNEIKEGKFATEFS